MLYCKYAPEGEIFVYFWRADILIKRPKKKMKVFTIYFEHTRGNKWNFNNPANWRNIFSEEL